MKNQQKQYLIALQKAVREKRQEKIDILLKHLDKDFNFNL